jgi:RNA polymerase sigma factor (sigma-70 family)
MSAELFSGAHPTVDGADAPKHPEEWALVQGCLRGERGRWVELLSRYEATVHFSLLHVLRSRGMEPTSDELADLQADFFLALVKDHFHKLGQYSGRSRLGHWLKVVASHFAIDHLRQRRNFVSLDDPAPQAVAVARGLEDREPDPERSLQREQLAAAVRALYEHLPDEDRRFLQLYVEHELGFEEIARQMQTTVGAIYARKNRVRKKLIALAQEQDIL